MARGYAAELFQFFNQTDKPRLRVPSYQQASPSCQGTRGSRTGAEATSPFSLQLLLKPTPATLHDLGQGQLRSLNTWHPATQLTLCHYLLPLTPAPVLETHAAVPASAQPHVLALEASLS